MAAGAGAGMAAGAMMGRGQRGPPPGYDNAHYDNNGPRPAPYDERNSPPPMADETIGRAIEMDERTGAQPENVSSNNYGLRDSDGDVAGMVGLQQGRAGPMNRQPSGGQSSGVLSPSSVYSRQPSGGPPPAGVMSPSVYSEQ